MGLYTDLSELMSFGSVSLAERRPRSLTARPIEHPN